MPKYLIQYVVINSKEIEAESPLKAFEKLCEESSRELARDGWVQVQQIISDQEGL